VTHVIEFLEGKGFDWMTVALNGWDGVIYEYTMGSRFPNARFLNLGEVEKTEYPEPAFAERVDFVICEDLYYGKLTPCAEYERYFERDFLMIRNFPIEHSWGVTDAEIYGRR